MPETFIPKLGDTQGNLLLLRKGLDFVHGPRSVCLGSSRNIMNIVDDNGCGDDLPVFVVYRIMHDSQIEPEISQESLSSLPVVH